MGHKSANKRVERTADPRHASCGARAAPRVAVAHSGRSPRKNKDTRHVIDYGSGHALRMRQTEG